MVLWGGLDGGKEEGEAYVRHLLLKHFRFKFKVNALGPPHTFSEKGKGEGGEGGSLYLNRFFS